MMLTYVHIRHLVGFWIIIIESFNIFVDLKFLIMQSLLSVVKTSDWVCQTLLCFTLSLVGDKCSMD